MAKAAANSQIKLPRNGKFSKDHIWLWDGPGNTLGPSIYGLGDSLQFLNVKNVVCMWLPSTTKEEIILEKLKNCKRIVWEITAQKWLRRPFKSVGYGHEQDQPPDGVEHIGWFREDSWSYGRGYESKEEARKISDLSRKYPNLAGGLLDYSFSGFASRGGTPEHLKEIYLALKEFNPNLQLHWMVYKADCDMKWQEYFPYIDVLSLWEPKKELLKDLDATVDKCIEVFPDKQILLGLYVIDYWAKRLEPGEDHPMKWHKDWAVEPMPLDLMELQITKAVELVNAGKISGFQLMTEAIMDKFPETADQIKKLLESNLRQ